MGFYEALRSVRRVIGQREPVRPRLRGVLGDGSGNVEVTAGYPYNVYFRRRDSDGAVGNAALEQVQMLRGDIPAIDGMPVVVGEDNVVSGLQVLSRDADSLMDWLFNWILRSHHEQHELYNEVGFDVVWVQSQQFMPLLVYPTDPASMQVNVAEGFYPWADGWNWFPATVSIDLSGYVPTGLPQHVRFVLISIAGASNALQYTQGNIFPRYLSPAQVTDMIPTVPAGSVPIGAIYLPYGTTSLTFEDNNFYDVRLFSSPVGSSITPAPHDILSAEHSDTEVDAIVRGDLMAVNLSGDWARLSAGTPYQLLTMDISGDDPEWASFDWDDIATAAGADMIHDHSAAGEGGVVIAATSFTGTATVSADWAFDDGVGDSPTLSFVGGSNNDTAILFLDDDAVAGDSDFVLRLPAADTGSQFQIQTNAGAVVAWIDAAGNSEFEGAMFIDGTAPADVQLTVQAAAAQAANIKECQDSLGNIVSGVDERGVPFCNMNNNALNTYYGNNAGALGDTGDYNTYIGSNAGSANTSGNRNTGVGADALRATTTGLRNAVLGVALYNNIDGSYNMAIGFNAMAFNVNGDYNAAIGESALVASTGSHNTGIGSRAGRRQGTGSNNTFIGSGAGEGVGAYNASGNVLIGYQAGFNEVNSNRLYIANSNTTTPLVYGLFTGAGAGITIYSQNAAGVPLTVRGIAAQASNLLELQDSLGAVLRASNALGVTATVHQAIALGVGVTTFAVTSNVMTITGDPGANIIATITGGVNGQLLTLIFVDALVTVTDDNTHAANTVDLSGAFVSADDTTLQLVFDGTSWYETSRSVN